MLRKQEFKTLAGAQKRAAFENAHCDKRYHYAVVRCVAGVPDTDSFNILRYSRYTWRIEKKPLVIVKHQLAPYPEAAKEMARKAGIKLEEQGLPPDLPLEDQATLRLLDKLRKTL
jgi:hypothetical protein